MDEGQSPVIPRKPEGDTRPKLDFPGAMRAIIEGKRITKLEWGDERVYGHLKDGFLMLTKVGKDHSWTVSEGDLKGLDYVVLPVLN